MTTSVQTTCGTCKAPVKQPFRCDDCGQATCHGCITEDPKTWKRQCLPCAWGEATAQVLAARKPYRHHVA